MAGRSPEKHRKGGGPEQEGAIPRQDGAAPERDNPEPKDEGAIAKHEGAPPGRKRTVRRGSSAATTRRRLRPGPADAGGEIVLGSYGPASELGLLGWADGRPVFLDMGGARYRGTIQERAQTIAIFGAAGSGKAHTAGVILEMSVMAIPGISRLREPLAGVVFHQSRDEARASEFLGPGSLGSVPPDLESLKKPGTVSPGPGGVRVICAVPKSRSDIRSKELPDVDLRLLAFDPSELGVDDWRNLLSSPSGDRTYAEQLTVFLDNVDLPASVEGIRDAIDRSETDRDFRRTARMRLNHAQRYLHLPEALSWDHYARPGAVTILDARARSIDEHDAMSLCLLSLRRLQTVRSWGRRGPSMPMLVVLDEAGRYLHTDRGREAMIVLEGTRRTETHVVIAAQDPGSLRHIKHWCSAFARLKPSDLLSLQPGEAYVWAREATDPRFTAGCVRMRVRDRVSQPGAGPAAPRAASPVASAEQSTAPRRGRVACDSGDPLPGANTDSPYCRQCYNEPWGGERYGRRHHLTIIRCHSILTTLEGSTHEQ